MAKSGTRKRKKTTRKKRVRLDTNPIFNRAEALRIRAKDLLPQVGGGATLKGMRVQALIKKLNDVQTAVKKACDELGEGNGNNPMYEDFYV